VNITLCKEITKLSLPHNASRALPETCSNWSFSAVRDGASPVSTRVFPQAVKPCPFALTGWGYASSFCTMTTSLLGPWAPMISFFSMSAVRLQPVMSPTYEF
jgi:hypothetical protein